MKLPRYCEISFTVMSPSLGREWIEILQMYNLLTRDKSPSLGREWIEISLEAQLLSIMFTSPSLGREWIEMGYVETFECDLFGLPPWGGSGLKSMYIIAR